MSGIDTIKGVDDLEKSQIVKLLKEIIESLENENDDFNPTCLLILMYDHKNNIKETWRKNLTNERGIYLCERFKHEIFTGQIT